MGEKDVFADFLREASSKLTKTQLELVRFVIQRERLRRFDRRDDLPGSFAVEALRLTGK